MPNTSTGNRILVYTTTTIHQIHAPAGAEYTVKSSCKPK